MPYSNTPLEQFAGLDTQTVSDGAIDILNVRVDDPDQLSVRPGYQQRETTAYAGITTVKGYVAGGQYQLVVSDLGVKEYSTLGLTTSGSALLTNLTGSGIYAGGVFLLGRSSGAITYWNGLNLTAVPGAPAGRFLCAMPGESRVVVANAGMGSALDYRVWFSDPTSTAVPAFTSTSFVDLEPQDSGWDVITAAVNWRDLVFVFKNKRFFVFTGSSTTASGAAQFNYRPVDTGIGCTQDHGAVAGQTGCTSSGRTASTARRVALPSLSRARCADGGRRQATAAARPPSTPTLLPM
jgi:hypothetical protein